MKMMHKFFDSLDQETRTDKYHGKPLIRQYGPLLSRVRIIIEFALSILFIALINLAALGLLVLLHTPMREFILGN